MADIGDVIGTHPGPWWFDMDSRGTKSRSFATRNAAEDAGKAFAAAVGVEDPAKASPNGTEAAGSPDERPSLTTQAMFARWQAGQGR